MPNKEILSKLFHFENELLPVYLNKESINDHITHSDMPHWHDCIELIVVESGTVTCSSGGTNFSLYKGDVCFINRHQLHHLKQEDEDSSCHTVMIIGTTLLSQYPLVYEKYVQPVLEDVQFSHIRFEGNASPAAHISDLVMHAFSVNNERAPGYELDMISTVYKIFGQIYSAYITAPKTHLRDINMQLQQRMAEYIYANYSEPISLDDIAASGNISRSQCSRLFKQYTSLSPINFLNLHRLEMGRDQLRSTTFSIAEIAQNCGFSDQSYFSRMFVKQYNITPIAYRKGSNAK